MSRKSSSVRDRQIALQQEEQEKKDGERSFTTAGIKSMYMSIGSEINCTIAGHCRTMVLKFPGIVSRLASSVPNEMIFNSNSMCAHLSTDLLDYFSTCTGSPHYSISPPLKYKIEELIKNEKDEFPVYLVIEDFVKFDPTVMNKGECSIAEQAVSSDGDVTRLLIGGNLGEKFITLWGTADGELPDFPDNQRYINLVLAAVRVEQGIEGPIRADVHQRCFVTDDGRYVNYVCPTISLSPFGLSVKSPLDERTYKEKATRIRDAIGLIEPDIGIVRIDLLVSALDYSNDKRKDDEYNRLYYLRLWQSLVESGRLLLCMSEKDPRFDKLKIAGDKTLGELKAYRNAIAHWSSGMMKVEYLSNLFKTINELLRRRYF
ncbi:MAG: hypothetical protein OXR72_18385 [Gemmatimonadota bacterium]|nr:hypothetical protein [Gemmatimonadota bacterium]